MRIIGLTGSIACGKSTVSEYLVSRGFPVIDGDVLSRELTAEGSPLLQQIRQVFGPSVFLESGALDRRRLGKLVFSDEKSLRKLDDLMYTPLLALTKSRIREIQSAGAELCFLDMALLFEKEFDRLCDTTWTVWLPEDVQLSRLMTRDGLTRQEALARICSVLSSDEKAARARIIIDNSGPISSTLSNVASLLQEELRRARPAARTRRSGRLSIETAGSSSLPDDSVSSSPADMPVSPSLPPVSTACLPVSPVGQNIPSRKPAVSRGPVLMERPEAAHRKPSSRSVSLPLPVWLKAALLALAALLLIGIAVYAITGGNLKQLKDQHLAEKVKVENYYHRSDLFPETEKEDNPGALRSLIEKYAKLYNLNPAFVTAVIRNESSFQPSAESHDSQGKVIARGLMQLKEDTAAWIAGKLKVQGYAYDRMFDPESNIHFGCWYLNYLSGLFGGRPACVVAAYHAGQGQVTRWLSDTAVSPDGLSLDPENLPDGPTKNYTKEVLKCYGVYQEMFDQASLSAADSGNGLSSSDGTGDQYP